MPTQHLKNLISFHRNIQNKITYRIGNTIYQWPRMQQVSSIYLPSKSYNISITHHARHYNTALNQQRHEFKDDDEEEKQRLKNAKSDSELQHDFTDLERKILEEKFREAGVKEFPIPKPGKSSGDPKIDEATKNWRRTNTKDDEKLAKLFKKSSNSSHSLLQQSNRMMNDDDDDQGNEDWQVSIEDEEEAKQFVNPYNPETGEYNGPTGLEPTRYGDWERSGRCYDF